MYRLLDRHFRTLSLVWDERFAATAGRWRAVIPKVVDQFLACGRLEHGFARIRCDACAHEYLLALSCNARYFCPSCHANRIAQWSQWLDETLLAPVPHRQVVLTIPKRLRAHCLFRRSPLGELDADWSPDGTRLAAACGNGVYREHNGRPDGAFSLREPADRVRWDPSGHLLAFLNVSSSVLSLSNPDGTGQMFWLGESYVFDYLQTFAWRRP